ncbi:pyridoxal 5'-phosphate synthase [Dokdonia sp.]|uniref:pyridoxine/pyridoxamine 5'-phosphate oxidase n=1 Tax=Dokdonia sp. TaxID=2024995 RepID=UPI003263811C
MEQQEYPDPFNTFAIWLHQHVVTTKSKHPSACVLSTIGLDGFPNTRYLALKELNHPYLIVTGSLNSRKGKEIEANPKVSLTFWWEESLRQVRIQGEAQHIDDKTADIYFSERSKEAQTVSTLSNQGNVIQNISELKVRFRESIQNNTPIKRPKHWSGWKILPKRIEFLEFKTSRLHHRTLYTHSQKGWKITQLQP